jgi:hypothetical protein
MNFRCKSCLLLLLFNLWNTWVGAHAPAYASLNPTQGSTFGFPINGINNPENAITNNNNTYAEVYTFFGETWLQLKYTNVLNSGTTSFIRVETPGQSLSNLINDEIKVDAYNNATISSNGTFAASPSVTIVQDQNYTYLAVTPAAQYNSIRIRLSTTSFRISPYVLRAYYSFYNSSDAADCGTGWAADIGEKSTGAAAASFVSNPKSATDNSRNTYSTLQLTTNQQNIQIAQTIYFSATSYISNIIQLTASVSSVVNSNDYRIEAQAYHGLTTVGSSQNITSQLNAAAGAPVDLFINPGSYFDRVKISITANNNGTQTGHVNIHNVQLVPETPTLQQATLTSCTSTGSSSVTFQVTNSDSAIEYRWYNNNVLIPGATASSYTGSFSSSTGSHSISVSAVKVGCSSESEKTNASVNVKPKPLTPAIAVL